MLLLRRTGRNVIHFLFCSLTCLILVSPVPGQEGFAAAEVSPFQEGMEDRLNEVERLLLMGDFAEALGLVEAGLEIVHRDALWIHEARLWEQGFSASREIHGAEGGWAWVQEWVLRSDQSHPRRLRFGGEAALQLGDLDQAEQLLTEALQQAVALGLTLEEAHAAFSLGQVAAEAGESLPALEWNTRALELYRDLKRFADVARCYLLRTEIQFASGDFSLARINAMAAEDLARQYQLDAIGREALRLLAASQLRMGDLTSALESRQRYEDQQAEAAAVAHARTVQALRADRDARLSEAYGKMVQLKHDLEDARASKVEARTEARGLRIGVGLSLLLVLLLSTVWIRQLLKSKQSQFEARIGFEKSLQEAETELQALRDHIEELNTANGRFLSNISHEIRTPMNAVIGMATLLADTALNEEQRECVSTISSSSHALLGILNDILDFARIESGSIRLQRIPFYLQSVIDEVVDMFAAPARSKGVPLISKVSPYVPRRVVGDPVRLRQILHNIVSNALKYTDRGEVSIHVTRVTATLEGVVLGFSIRDTGIGIPSEMKKKIFEPFVQAHADLDRHFGGSGLGLAVCQRLVSLMDGDIWVESEPGRGATFHFTLHLGVDRRKIEERLEGAHCLGKTALLIDGDETVRRVLSIHAGQVGVSCLQSASLEEALQILSEGQQVHVILFDLEIPRTQPAVTIDKLRRVPGHQDTPLVGLLTDPADASRKAYTRLRLSDYLSKTPRRETLFDALAKALSIHPVDQPNPPMPLPEDAPKLRILVAEDNTINQRVAYLLLRNLGYEATLANDGREVLAILEDQTFDLILMDIHMPEMDGVEATRMIRQKLAPPQQPRIFAMTAAITDEDRRKCQEAGMDGFLSKPVEIEVIAKVVRQIKPLPVP